MTTISDVKNHIAGMMHGSTVNKIRNFYHVCERASNTLRSNIKPVDLMRDSVLTQPVHDDLNNYAAPSDFGEIIDLAPQANRSILDKSQRNLAEVFSAERSIKNRIISIEGSEGTKFLRINWKIDGAKTFHNMNSLTANGTWSVVGSATGLVADEQYKFSGSASIRFNVVASGDGIQITDASALDLTDEDEVGDVLIAIYVPDKSNLTSFTPIWGNNLTTAYWTGVAQTAQADGTAFRNGWNIILIPWGTATETGTVAPATVDSFKLTVQSTGAINKIRVDNILFSMGTPFAIKYFSKYAFKNSAGTYLQRPTTDDDTIVYDGIALQIFLMEVLKASAQQAEGEDSAFDINYANRELNGDPNSPDPSQRVGLYARFRGEEPSQAKKAVQRWSSGPRFRR